MLALRQAPIHFSENITVEKNAYEYAFEVFANQEATVYLYADSDKKHFVTLSINTIDGKIVLDRSDMAASFGAEFGVSRQLTLTGQENVKVNVFVDESVLEVFINDGAYVLSSRIFTADEQQKNIFAEGTDNNVIYPLQK